MISILVSLLLSSNAYSLSWGQVAKSKYYKLSSSLNIKNSQVVISASTPVWIEERLPLSIINVENYRVRIPGCDFSSQASQLEVYEVTNTSGLPTTIGIELMRNCYLEIFVEMKDLSRRSLFDE